MKLICKLLDDERGFIVTIELLLIVTIVVIGLIAGLAVLRDAIVTELNETSAAISEMNQEVGPPTAPLNVSAESIDFEAGNANNCVEVYSGFRDF